MNASQREFLQKTAKETKVRIGFATSSLSSLPSVDFLVSPHFRICTADIERNKDWIGFEPLRSLRFLLLISFTSCFAELAGRLNGICRVDQSKPRVSNLRFCKRTFVIFASFC